MNVAILLMLAVTIFILGNSFKSIMRKVSANLESYDYAIQTNGIYMLEVNKNGLIISANDIFRERLGINLEEGCKFIDILGDGSFEEFNSMYINLSLKDTAQSRLYIKGASGIHPIIWNAWVIKNFYGKITKYLFIGNDISLLESEKKYSNELLLTLDKMSAEISEKEEKIQKMEKLLSDSEANLLSAADINDFVLESLDIGVWKFDCMANEIYINNKLKTILDIEYSIDLDKIETLYNKIHEDDYLKVLEGVYGSISRKEPRMNYEFRIESVTGEIRFIEISGSAHYHNGKLAFISGSCKDISDRRRGEKIIEDYMFYDDLTNLSNRTYMNQYAANFFYKNKNARSALIYFDIDDFKYINDVFGHDFGDEVIIETANRILKISGQYKVSRFGGDEICIFIEDTTSIPNGLTDFLQKLLAVTNVNYTDDDSNISCKISISIGVSLYPEHGNNFGELLQRADIALNEAKKTGKNKILFFDETMNLKLQERVGLEQDLKNALESGSELMLYFQPQYDIKTNDLRGFEALTRWISPTRGIIPPSVFIPIAEETRLIIPLEKWVLTEACKILNILSQKGYPDIIISVNLSAIQLMDEYFVATVREVLRKTKINPASLELEITESILIENFDINIRKLNALKKMGISIALDDFGTEYSSLTYLKLLPISTLKIDKTFVDNILDSQLDIKITEEIIRLAHIMNLDTIAEGVERTEQLNILLKSGCDMVQGYLSGKPMPRDEIFGILDKKMLE